MKPSTKPPWRPSGETFGPYFENARNDLLQRGDGLEQGLLFGRSDGRLQAHKHAMQDHLKPPFGRRAE
jgi:hypothetical protein